MGGTGVQIIKAQGLPSLGFASRANLHDRSTT